MSSCRPWGSRAALKKEGPESGAIGAKGLWAPGGTTRTHQGVRLKPLSRSLGRETSGSCQDMGGVGTDCGLTSLGSESSVS